MDKQISITKEQWELADALNDSIVKRKGMSPFIVDRDTRDRNYTYWLTIPDYDRWEAKFLAALERAAATGTGSDWVRMHDIVPYTE